MRSIPVIQKTRLYFILIASVLMLTNCKKPPEPSFTYIPADNPEAGDTIKFTNTTLEGESYEWDFGNGSVSTEENPYTFYETPGTREVTLTATNEDGSATITESLTINDPTLLGFFVYDDTTLTTEIPGCEVWLYDNESDFLNQREPQFFEIADNEGFVLFMNLEPQVYFAFAYKEETDGYWAAGGATQSLEQNTGQAYTIVCDFYADTTNKKVLESKLLPGKVRSGLFKRDPGE